MGHANSKRLLEYTRRSEEEHAVQLLDTCNFIDTNFTNNHGDTSLHLACANGLKKLVSKLLDNEADVNRLNKFNSTPLHIATRNNNVDIVRKLLKRGAADVSIEGEYQYTAITIACAHNHISIARLLLEYKAFIEDRTLLCAAVHNSDSAELVRILLNHGANVNSTDKYQNTALMHACIRGNAKVVEVLISREWKPMISINKQNKYGWTALHFAYASSANPIAKHNIISMLLKKNANVKLKNDDGRTPKDEDSVNTTANAAAAASSVAASDDTFSDYSYDSHTSVDPNTHAAKRRRTGRNTSKTTQNTEKPPPRGGINPSLNLIDHFNEASVENRDSRNMASASDAAVQSGDLPLSLHIGEIDHIAASNARLRAVPYSPTSAARASDPTLSSISPAKAPRVAKAKKGGNRKILRRSTRKRKRSD